ncbi:MAG: tyrosine-type recombinase/integrase [Clostridiales bacterium]|nr:tyrosine-type recombinase/integrase [Clostridiales bacterium]
MGKNLKGKEIGKGLSQRENGKYSARFVLYNGKRISRCFESKINLKKDTPDEFRDIVFLNRKGLPTKNSAYDTHIYKICEKCGMRTFSMHTIRHTFATHCVESGMNFKTLQTILGHS